MSVLDKNRVFFGLIHYILSEQMNVDWILKTSLIDFVGVSSVLEEKPYKKDSLLDDIVDYITQIKPYHVQFSHYFEHYETASEQVNIPKNDWIEPTIELRFDSIQSTPDIVKIFYQVVDKLPTSSNYNDIGLEIFNTSNNKFYYRDYLQDEENKYYWDWIEEDIALEDGVYYTTYNSNSTFNEDNYYTVKNGIMENVFDKESFINSHLANRLFYLGIHDFNELKKELNANFKGLEINGSTFELGQFGYDVYNYETTDYDSPTIIYDYCIVDKTEKFDYFTNKSESFTYEKHYVESGSHRFNIPSTLQNKDTTLVVYKQKGTNEPYPYTDYNISFSGIESFIDIFNGLSIDEKVIITSEVFDENMTSTIISAYVIHGYPFSPSNSDILKREYAYLNNGTLSFKIPAPEIDNNDISVQLRRANRGGQSPFMNYTLNNDSILINSADLKHGDHIIIVSFDYKYLYDKIYVWEDKYGRSNNIINLTGDKFLRAAYEENRPRELVASSPLSSLVMYKFDDPDMSANQLFINDYKNDMLYYNYDYGQFTTIEDLVYAELRTNDDIKMIINEIKLSDISMLAGRLDKNGNPQLPGKILVNSEIIEYNEIDVENKTIKSLRRGVDGSIVYIGLNPKYHPYKLTHEIGDRVYPYYTSDINEYEKNNKYIAYTITNPRQKTYDCPYGINVNTIVEVQKLKKINLLQDVYGNSKEIILDSCNVVNQPLQDILNEEESSTKHKAPDGEYFTLKINDDVIPFTTIYKNKSKANTFHITGITLPAKYQNMKKDVIYSTKDTFVHSCIPEDFDNYDLSMVSSDNGYFLVNDNNNTYIYVDEKYVAYTENDNNKLYYNYLYRIESSILYDANDEELGVVRNNIAYDIKGDIYGRIDGETFYKTKNVIKINEDLIKGESYIINVY
jgi:hypothetical protein